MAGKPRAISRTFDCAPHNTFSVQMCKPGRQQQRQQAAAAAGATTAPTAACSGWSMCTCPPHPHAHASTFIPLGQSYSMKHFSQTRCYRPNRKTSLGGGGGGGGCTHLDLLGVVVHNDGLLEDLLGQVPLVLALRGVSHERRRLRCGWPGDEHVAAAGWTA